MLGPSHSFLGKISSVVSRNRVDWKSAFFTADRVGSWGSAVLAVRLSNQSGPQAELDAEISRLGGIQSPELWNQYFKSYDKVVGYCDGYVDLLEKANAVLPLRGRVLDIGAGTGNFSARLLSEAAHRQIIAVDRSLTGLQVAKKKMQIFDCAQTRFQIQPGDIRYVVLSQRPLGTESWTEEQLRTLITRECLIGVAVPVHKLG